MDSNEQPPFSPPPPPPPPPPPVFNPPPVIMPAATPPPPKRGRGWMIFAIILLVLLGFSMLANLGQFANGLSSVSTRRSQSSGPKLDEVFYEDNDAASKIAVIDIDGIITSRNLDQGAYSLVDLIQAQLDQASEDRKVKAVVLRMDSPGGEVLASDEIYRALADFQDESGKPVVTSMGNLVASGGYYISAASRWIVANELTITGSIGVIMHTWNYRDLMDKVGLRPEVFKSGKFKDMLSGERKGEIPAEERAMVDALINETYTRFQEVVAEGRDAAHELNKDTGKSLVNDWKSYADGRVFSGTQAYEWGFVDELGNFSVAVDRAKKLAGIKGDADLIQYRMRHDLSDFFRLFGKSEAPVVKVDLGLETPKLQAGQLYFLAPTSLH